MCCYTLSVKDIRCGPFTKSCPPSTRCSLNRSRKHRFPEHTSLQSFKPNLTLMHKTWLITRREYLSRVRKKSFLILTLLVPVLVAGFLALEIFLAMGGNKKTQHIAVIDESGLFGSHL